MRFSPLTQLCAQARGSTQQCRNFTFCFGVIVDVMFLLHWYLFVPRALHSLQPLLHRTSEEMSSLSFKCIQTYQQKVCTFSTNRDRRQSQDYLNTYHTNRCTRKSIFRWPVSYIPPYTYIIIDTAYSSSFFFFWILFQKQTSSHSSAQDISAPHVEFRDD